MGKAGGRATVPGGRPQWRAMLRYGHDPKTDATERVPPGETPMEGHGPSWPRSQGRPQMEGYAQIWPRSQDGRDGARPSRGNPNGGPRSLVAAIPRPPADGGPCSDMATIPRRTRRSASLQGKTQMEGHGPLVAVRNGGPCSVMAALKPWGSLPARPPPKKILDRPAAPWLCVELN